MLASQQKGQQHHSPANGSAAAPSSTFGAQALAGTPPSRDGDSSQNGASSVENTPNSQQHQSYQHQHQQQQQQHHQHQHQHEQQQQQQQQQQEESQQHQQQRPKQKRNKPTLSCRECVDRKTKCDRGRPNCEACVKRGSFCVYSEVADLLAGQPDKPSKARKTNKAAVSIDSFNANVTTASAAAAAGGTNSAGKISIANITNPEATGPSPQQRFFSQSPPAPPPGLPYATHLHSTEPKHGAARPHSLSLPARDGPPPSSRTPVALSSLAMPNSAPISIFGIGNRHPFANYWTATGGLREVVGVLPTKDQADILIAKYFEIIDPLYPILDRDDFIEKYEAFWHMSYPDKCDVDAALLALHFVVYASATQFIELAFPSDQPKTAEFYISAAHQSLRISSYWNHVTMATVQAMAMTFYFLINDNHVSDAYTHTGMTVRQAYVLQLNRNPEVVDVNLTAREKGLRLRLWQTVMHQDVGLTQFLKLPPAATHTDITPDFFDRYASPDDADDRISFGLGTRIAATSPADRDRTDLAFSKCLYVFTSFIMENICAKRALGLPICNSMEHKRDLCQRFRALYASLPRPFGTYDAKRYLAANKRLARQQISLGNNYFHSMMLIYVDEDPERGVTMDVWGTLEAAHEAIGSFFAMFDMFGQETDGFWAYQHRAFEIAITIANLLAVKKRPSPPPGLGNNLSQGHILLRTAKEDVKRMLDIMHKSRGYFAYQSVPEPRYDVLRKVYDQITLV